MVDKNKRRISVVADQAFIIRSITDVRVNFYMAPRIWTAAPASATIFQDRKAAEHVVFDLVRGSFRLPDEEFDVLPIEEAIRTYGSPTDVRRKGG